ncbi:putative palmitoyltransferase [Phytophthora cinnamomi]|uniref:putative palmitoyltransferase n=1 Tax=Phytophthora cinnamomi TaxID=4785 RepID=UPI003559F942|nr:putative palmitoyltransferase [Phytophthora cinnamomi]
MQSLVANNQALGFVTAMCLMTSIIVWVFVMMQLKRIAQNETANESFKREDLREEAELDGETSGRRMFRFLFRRLQFRKRPKLSVPRREQKKTLDASWGGLFSPDSIMNTEESFSVEDVDFNPYKLGSFKENLLDALHLRHSSDSKQKTN